LTRLLVTIASAQSMLEDGFSTLGVDWEEPDVRIAQVRSRSRARGGDHRRYGGVIGHAASYAFAASTGRSSYSGMTATASISTSAPGRACPAVETTVIAVR
jgi:hypothetical protein